MYTRYNVEAKLKFFAKNHHFAVKFETACAFEDIELDPKLNMVDALYAVFRKRISEVAGDVFPDDWSLYEDDIDIIRYTLV